MAFLEAAARIDAALPSRPWGTLDAAAIFARVDAFVPRCHDLQGDGTAALFADDPGVTTVSAQGMTCVCGHPRACMAVGASAPAGLYVALTASPCPRSPPLLQFSVHCGAQPFPHQLQRSDVDVALPAATGDDEYLRVGGWCWWVVGGGGRGSMQGMQGDKGSSAGRAKASPAALHPLLTPLIACSGAAGGAGAAAGARAAPAGVLQRGSRRPWRRRAGHAGPDRRRHT